MFIRIFFHVIMEKKLIENKTNKTKNEEGIISSGPVVGLVVGYYATVYETRACGQHIAQKSFCRSEDFYISTRSTGQGQRRRAMFSSPSPTPHPLSPPVLLSLYITHCSVILVSMETWSKALMIGYEPTDRHMDGLTGGQSVMRGLTLFALFLGGSITCWSQVRRCGDVDALRSDGSNLKRNTCSCLANRERTHLAVHSL